MGTLNKKFREWEKKFSREQIREERKLWLTTVTDDIIYKWPFEVEQWPQDRVQFAVYDASDAERWQLFRCSLKGLSTSDKLICLWSRRSKYICTSQASIEKCRIDNYLGALVRGGLLNSEYEVIK